jgi:hypothetical protein
MNSFRKLRAFCRVLKGSKLWRVDRGQLRIRLDSRELDGEMDFCPLTYWQFVVTGEAAPVHHWRDAAEAAGFEKLQGREIAAAADCIHGDAQQLKLRRILEKACGV